MPWTSFISQDREVAENELKILKELSHVHVLAYVDSFVVSDMMYIITEYCSGGDLSGFLDQIGRPVPEDLLLVWLWQMACGLEVCTRHLGYTGHIRQTGRTGPTGRTGFRTNRTNRTHMHRTNRTHRTNMKHGTNRTHMTNSKHQFTTSFIQSLLELVMPWVSESLSELVTPWVSESLSELVTPWVSESLSERVTPKVVVAQIMIMALFYSAYPRGRRHITTKHKTHVG